MAGTFKPGFWLEVKECGETKSKWHSFPTYRELKKELRKLLLSHEEITVFRHRRGEWGEWFETFRFDVNKGRPVIVKQGWM